MDENKIRQIAQEVAQENYDKNSAQDQFAVATTSFHKHNGQDSPKFPFVNLSDVPLSYYTQKGHSLIVNGTENLLEFSAGTVATTNTDSFLVIPNCAGTPTGTPTGGTGSIVLDTSAGKLWIYYGGAWKGVLLA